MPNSLEQNNEEVIPSVYVDQRVLIPVVRPPVRSAYKINDQEFIDAPPAIDDKFVEFKVYAAEVGKRGKMEEGDVYCSTPTDSGSECGDDSTSVFKITLQPVTNGYIINNSCFLTWQQWHTLISASISDRLLHCIVCAAYIELSSGEAHVGTLNHRAALQAYPPLEKLDISITRKIRNQYHCGVCNEVFDLKDGNDHFCGKMHEGNLLFAINRASDLLDNYGYAIDTSNRQTDTYHFKTHQMSDTASVGESVGSDCANDNLNYINWQNNYQYDDYEDEFEPPVFTGLSYATMAKKPKAVTQNFLEIDFGNKKVKVRFDSWHMVISPKPNRFWCMVCKKFDLIRNKQDHCKEMQHLNNLDRCRMVEAYQDYFIRQVDDKLYHCGHCNNLQLIHEMEDHIQSNHPRKGQNKILDVKTPGSPMKNNENNKNNLNTAKNNNNSPLKVNVKNAQNSVINNNNVNKPVTAKKSLLSNTSAAKSVPVSNNNSAAKSVPVPNNGATKSVPMSNNNAAKSAPVSNNSDAKSVPVSNNGDTNGLSHKMPGIFEDTVIFPFGYKITIPSLSYNIVCKRLNDFYCGLCDMICEEKAISSHVFEVRHLELLQRTPFIAPYSCNLIRAIRDKLHCAICNIPVTAAEIYNHIQNPEHADFLAKALNQNKLPPIGVKMPNIPETPKVQDTPIASPAKVKATPNATVDSSAPIFGAGNIGTNVPSALKFGTGNIGTNVASALKFGTGNIGTNVASAFKFGSANIGTNVGTPNVIDTSKPPPNFYIVQSPPLVATPTVSPNFGNKQESTQVEIKDNAEETETQPDNEEFEEEYEYDDEDEEEEDEMYNESGENDNTFDSVASEDATFDVEEYVYLKLKNTYIKISNTSYNTLVHVGDGSRYCFVCSNRVLNYELQRHVDSRPHLENMEQYRFLDKYEDHLLRQIYLMYHCAICNVLITRKELKSHLEWPTHALQNENTLKNIKKTRKNDIKGGIKQIIVSTQKENIYLHEKEPNIKISFNANVVQSVEDEDKKAEEFTRKNKIIIFNDNVLKFPWEHWQGISKIKNGYKCNLCQRDLKSVDIDVHCSSEWHKYSLDKPFEKQYAPALVRKINDSTLNCVICNTEVSNKPSLVAEHMNGKRHARAHDAILKDSSQARTYTDCHNDVLML